MAHELAWARYNDKIINTTCSRCGAPPRRRCKSALGEIRVIPAHAARIKAAGYKWNGKRKQLEPLT